MVLECGAFYFFTKGNTKYSEILAQYWEVNSTYDYYNITVICRSDLHSESTTTV